MNHHLQQQKQQGSLPAKQLREKKRDFQKDRKMLSRELEKKLKTNKDAVNPQRMSEDRRIVDSMQKKQQLFQNSVSHFQQSSDRSQYLHQREYFQDLRNEQMLSQNAKKFINRLRKQRQYTKGKFLLLRKKQEQRKQLQRKKKEEIKREYLEQYIRKRKQKAITNIILHQSRANYRYSESKDRPFKKSHVHSKTENDDHQLFPLTPIMHKKVPPIQIKQQLTNASPSSK